MATYAGTVLSNSTAGLPISVTATSTPGTALHTAGLTGYDAIWLWASNVTDNDVALTVEWGAAGVASQLVNLLMIPKNSPPIPVATGQRLTSGRTVKAFCGTAGAINITGHVNEVR